MKQLTLFQTTRYGLLSLLLVLALQDRSAHCQPDAVPIIRARHLFDLKADFIHPSDVTVGSQGHIYVLDGVKNRVMIFNPAGAYLSSFGTKGTGKGEFNNPLGIDHGQDGTIYIADSGNHRIQVFDPAGRFIFTFPLTVKNSPRSVDPTDVVIDETGNRCYVVDNDNHRILVYQKDGSRLLKQWGQSGEKPGEFQYPFLAALDQHATLYVVDVLNTRVQAINSEGRTMSLIGKWGVDRGQFYRPKGVAVDKNDRIYVSDSYLGVIQIFKRYRKFLGVLGDEAGAMLRFKTPTGIYVDNNLILYIVEMTKDTVAVYQMLE